MGEVILPDGTSVDVPEAEAVEIPAAAGGQNPFFLIIEPDDKTNGNLGIDLDEPGWLTTHADWLRKPGYWVLFHKQLGPSLVVHVDEGDQPYYTKRHIGSVMGGSGEIICYGLGKKKAVDGTVMRLWLMPNGMICGDDDIDHIGPKILRGA